MTTLHARNVLAIAICDAKIAVNRAQVALANAQELPLGVNVDEGDGSALFQALAKSYAALCEAEAVNK